MRNVETIERNHLRYRQCPNCAVESERDVNGVENIGSVALSYMRTGRKPTWQSRTSAEDFNTVLPRLGLEYNPDREHVI